MLYLEYNSNSYVAQLRNGSPVQFSLFFPPFQGAFFSLWFADGGGVSIEGVLCMNFLSAI